MQLIWKLFQSRHSLVPSNSLTFPGRSSYITLHVHSITDTNTNVISNRHVYIFIVRQLYSWANHDTHIDIVLHLKWSKITVSIRSNHYITCNNTFSVTSHWFSHFPWHFLDQFQTPDFSRWVAILLLMWADNQPETAFLQCAQAGVVWAWSSRQTTCHTRHRCAHVARGCEDACASLRCPETTCCNPATSIAQN